MVIFLLFIILLSLNLKLLKTERTAGTVLKLDLQMNRSSVRSKKSNFLNFIFLVVEEQVVFFQNDETMTASCMDNNIC